MKKKKIIPVIAAVAAVLLIASGVMYFGCGDTSAKKVVCPDPEVTVKNSEEFLVSHNFDKEAFMTKWKASSERITYRSVNNNNVYINYICAEKYNYNNPTIIFIGSYGYDYQYLFPQADYFLDLGYNVILFDQRAHGNNTAESFTFGEEESDDLNAVLDYIYNNDPTKLPPLGIYAQGTGALSACSNLMVNSNNYKFLILDDPELNGMDCAENMLKNEKGILPEKLLVKSGISKMESKYDIDFTKTDFTETDKNAKTIFLPVLILKHNNVAEYPAKSVDDFLANLSIGESDKADITFENSGFLNAFFDEKEKFEESVNTFVWTNFMK